MLQTTIFSLLAAAVTTVMAAPCAPGGGVHATAPGAIKCPIVLDGRVKASAALTDFDSASTSLFNPDYVKGNNLKWSQIIQFPTAAGNGRFDNDTYKPFEVTISDASLFQQQHGFRRAGLQFKSDSNNGSPGTTGVKTIHFSIKWDAQRPLNLSHEYLNVWHEAADVRIVPGKLNEHLIVLGSDPPPVLGRPGHVRSRHHHRPDRLG